MSPHGNSPSPRSPGGSPRSDRKSLLVKTLIASGGLTEEEAESPRRLRVAQQPQPQSPRPDIPRFFSRAPDGRQPGAPKLADSADSVREMLRCFDGCESEGGLLMNDFVSVCKDLCNFPSFFNGPLCRRIRLLWRREHGAGAGRRRSTSSGCSRSSRGSATKRGEGKRGAESTSAEEEEEESDISDDSEEEEENIRISRAQFEHFWDSEMAGFDELDRFFRLIKQPECEWIEAADFAPYLEELLAYHPGLEFLESTPEFQEKYARTVIARIMYEVNTTMNGKITRAELRKSDLLKACHQVDEEEDINLVLRYFSYEHFYTLYVKFWELDTDHDFLLSPEDLMRHGGHALTHAIVERIFQQPVYQFLSGVPGRMGFEDFVFFFLAEEDKTNSVSLRYWFRCVDLDGDGVIRPWEMRHFYGQQLARLQSYGHEVITFADVVCQAHDFVHPERDAALRLRDFCSPRVRHISGMLFNILFNLNKFIAFEQRDPHYVRQQHENPHLTEWDRFAAIEYARMASAEEEREMEEENFASWGYQGQPQQQQQHQQHHVQQQQQRGRGGGAQAGNRFQSNESPF